MSVKFFNSILAVSIMMISMYNHLYLLEAASSKVKNTNHRIKVAIIGGAGFIGSFLGDHLTKEGFKVVGYDRNPLISRRTFQIQHRSSSQMTDKEINSYDVVIYLGGLTGRVSCEANRTIVGHQNVGDILLFAKRMKSDQLLIFASTSGILEGSGKIPRTESDILNVKLLDAYCKSLFEREYVLKKFHTRSNSSAPSMIGLRFGTVVGVSPAQRTDLFIPSIFKSAYSTGVIRLNQPDTYRAFLWNRDLAEAITQVIVQKGLVKNSFEIYHLQTLSASMIKVATTVALTTGARIEVNAEITKSNGFSLNSNKFETTFGFKPKGSLENIIKEYDQAMPESAIGKGPHMPPNVIIGSHTREGSIPCPVCGSHHLQDVLDLHEQPFANGFHESLEASLNVSTYPLKLMRCRECNHVFLSYIAERKSLFDDYLYQSGTSETLLKYFDWLADKVEKEVNELKGAHTVLEIACNDGSQLDKFKGRGWKTHGVDPAANIVPIAQAKGHDVIVGYWGSPDLKRTNFPSPNNLGAILAQNVLAHVPHPVDFLKACEKVMGEHTKLYIQTSQCQMMEEGQFDTAYHEHVSFFSGFSFKRAAELSNLRITNFELTPIHGTSCLVTFMKQLRSGKKDTSKTLALRLQEETNNGVTNDFFYIKYRERAIKITKWIIKSIKNLRKVGYKVGAYGAAAKGMVLLHFMLKMSTEAELGIEFVVDDAKLKQDRYCPGTAIPVWATEKLSKLDTMNNDYGIIVLAWNFWDEIASNIVTKLKGQKGQVVCIIPFPYPRIVSLDIESGSKTEISNMPYYPTELPNIIQLPRRQVMLITHFYNEELLLPYFIRHHAPMFDHAILIDYKSTDKSIEVIKDLAPPSWRIVPSSTGSEFFPGNPGNDGDVMFYENQYPDDWKISLTTTEFLVHPDLRSWLYKLDKSYAPTQKCLRFPAITMVGNDTIALDKHKSLPLQRSAYALVGQGKIKDRKITFPSNYDAGVANENNYGRYMHVGLQGDDYSYSLGRHGINLKEGAGVKVEDPKSGFIMKYLLTPWPESIPRKIQIVKNMRSDDIAKGLGLQHGASVSENAVTQIHDALLEGKIVYDLKVVGKASAPDNAHQEYHMLYNHAVDPEA